MRKMKKVVSVIAAAAMAASLLVTNSHRFRQQMIPGERQG